MTFSYNKLTDISINITEQPGKAGWLEVLFHQSNQYPYNPSKEPPCLFGCKNRPYLFPNTFFFTSLRVSICII